MLITCLLFYALGPLFFSNAVIDYIFGGLSAVTACVADISDCIIQERIQKVALLLYASWYYYSAGYFIVAGYLFR